MKALKAIWSVIKALFIIGLILVVLVFGLIFYSLRSDAKNDRSNYGISFNMKEGFHEEYLGPSVEETIGETIEAEHYIFEDILTETVLK